MDEILANQDTIVSMVTHMYDVTTEYSLAPTAETLCAIYYCEAHKGRLVKAVAHC